MASTPAFVATPRTPVASIANGDGTSYKALVTGAASGSRVDAVSVANSDAANPYVVQVAIQKSGVDYEIGEVTVPAGAGTNSSTKSVSLLNSTDLPFLALTESGSLWLESGAVFRVRSKSAVSGGNTLKFVGVAGDY